jgi:hypothetical protein
MLGRRTQRWCALPVAAPGGGRSDSDNSNDGAGAALPDSTSHELSDGDAAACSALSGPAVLTLCQRALQLLQDGGVRASTAAASARAHPFPLSDLILLARAAACSAAVPQLPTAARSVLVRRLAISGSHRGSLGWHPKGRPRADANRPNSERTSSTHTCPTRACTFRSPLPLDLASALSCARPRGDTSIHAEGVWPRTHSEYVLAGSRLLHAPHIPGGQTSANVRRVHMKRARTCASCTPQLPRTWNARACSQTAGTATHGVTPLGTHLLRRGTETISISRTFRIVSSSTRKFSTHDCTSSAVTCPAARILSASCCTACLLERSRYSASAKKSGRKAGQERRQRRCACVGTLHTLLSCFIVCRWVLGEWRSLSSHCVTSALPLFLPPGPSRRSCWPRTPPSSTLLTSASALVTAPFANMWPSASTRTTGQA